MSDSHSYLFVICPNRSGSTLWTKLLGTSPNVSLLPGPLHEGHVLPGIGRFMPTPDSSEQGIWSLNPEKYTNRKNYDWTSIKKLWESSWDLSRPVLVEKSPPNVLRADMLQDVFNPAIFIISIRNPYAVCEAMLRKNKNNKSLEQIARHWVASARFQLHNACFLKRNLVCTYEELTDDVPGTTKKLLCLVPELGQLNSAQSFSIKGNDMGITNLNEKQIRNLLPEQITEINSVLSPNRDILDSFGYSLLES